MTEKKRITNQRMIVAMLSILMVMFIQVFLHVAHYLCLLVLLVSSDSIRSIGFAVEVVFDLNSDEDKRLSWVTSCTPRVVSPEPIHPMIPRYIIRIDAPIRGAKELPKTSTKSEDPVRDGLLTRKM